MQLAIAHNPDSKEPKQLWNTIEKEIGDKEDQIDEIDHQAVNKLKSIFGQHKVVKQNK